MANENLGVSPPSVNFGLCHAPPLALQKPPKRVNMVEDPGGIAGTLRTGLVLLHPGGSVIVVGVWWNVVNIMVYLLVLSRLCCKSGIVCGLFLGVIQTFLKNGHP